MTHGACGSGRGHADLARNGSMITYHMTNAEKKVSRLDKSGRDTRSSGERQGTTTQKNAAIPTKHTKTRQQPAGPENQRAPPIHRSVTWYGTSMLCTFRGQGCLSPVWQGKRTGCRAPMKLETMERGLTGWGKRTDIAPTGKYMSAGLTGKPSCSTIDTSSVTSSLRERAHHETTVEQRQTSRPKQRWKRKQVSTVLKTYAHALVSQPVWWGFYALDRLSGSPCLAFLAHTRIGDAITSAAQRTSLSRTRLHARWLQGRVPPSMGVRQRGQQQQPRSRPTNGLRDIETQAPPEMCRGQRG